MIPLARPYFDADDLRALGAVLDSGQLIQGPSVAGFEAALSRRLDGQEVVAVSSGTAALHLALLALDLPPRATVMVPDYTFPATINTVLAVGLTPVPLDIDPSTYNVLPEEVLGHLGGPRPPAAFLPVHEFGLPAELAALLGPLEAAGVLLIEDAACAMGSATSSAGRRRPAGTLGRMGCSSFHPRKVLCTGEGGAVCTSDLDLANRLRRLRNHGMVRPAGSMATEFVEVGLNYRLSELHAALGGVQIGRLDAFLDDRRRIAEGYLLRLAPDQAGCSTTVSGLCLPRIPADVLPNWQSFVVRLPQGSGRDDTLRALLDRGVECAPGAHALHLQPAYRHLPGFDRPFPGAEDAWSRAIALPMPWRLSDTEMDEVVAALRGVAP